MLADDFVGVLADGRVIDKAEFLRQAAEPPDARDLRLRDVVDPRVRGLGARRRPSSTYREGGRDGRADPLHERLRAARGALGDRLGPVDPGRRAQEIDLARAGPSRRDSQRCPRAKSQQAPAPRPGPRAPCLRSRWRARGGWRGRPRAGHRWSAGRGRQAVRLRADGVSHWDTSLVAFVGEAQRWCADAGVACDTAPLPEKMRLLGGQFAESLRAGPARRPLAEPARRGGARDPRGDGPGARFPAVHRGMLDRREAPRRGAGGVPLERLPGRDAEMRRDGPADRQPDQLPRRA